MKWIIGLLLSIALVVPRAEAGAPGGKTEAGSAAAENRLRLTMMTGIPAKWKLDENFEVFLKQLEAARAGKPDLFVTPECWLDGYAAAAKDSSVARLRGIAQDPDASPYLARVAKEARERGIMLCFGFTSLEDGKLYNAAGLWDKDGRRIGIYHKTHLQTHDLQFTPGASLPCWPTPWGPMGIMICADRRWPETARVLRLQGARLILNPSYGMHSEKNEWWMRTRSYENQCFVAFVHPNTAFVADPGGDLAARHVSDQAGILSCEIDLSEAKDDNHLSDRRPELYGILTEPKH